MPRMITEVHFYDPLVSSGTWMPKSDDPFTPPDPCVAVGRVAYEDKNWLILVSLENDDLVNINFVLYKRSIVGRKDYF